MQSLHLVGLADARARTDRRRMPQRRTFDAVSLARNIARALTRGETKCRDCSSTFLDNVGSQESGEKFAEQWDGRYCTETTKVFYSQRYHSILMSATRLRVVATACHPRQPSRPGTSASSVSALHRSARSSGSCGEHDWLGNYAQQVDLLWSRQ